MVALLMVAYATTILMVIGFALIHGLAWGIRGPLMQAMRADYFGRTSFGVIMGFSSMIIMFGNTGGPLLAGILADRTGSYESGFTIIAGIAGAASLFFLFAKRPQPPIRLAKAPVAATPVAVAE
jgi:MFS family permease